MNAYLIIGHTVHQPEYSCRKVTTAGDTAHNIMPLGLDINDFFSLLYFIPVNGISGIPSSGKIKYSCVPQHKTQHLPA
jgi:hypothetical protein